MTSKPRIVQLAMVQMTCTKSQKENTDKAIAKVEQAASMGANIVCLQELFNAPYPCQSEDYERFAWAETIPGPTSI
ncbi:MAG: nitrilase-related carbon-nitrogen hydrolase, partial [Pirellula sp.]